MAVITLNQIVQNLNEIANKHQQLHGFKFGDPWEFYTSGTCDCAELWVQPMSVPATLNTIDYTFTIWLLDGVRRGEVNETEVMSDMFLIAQDIISQLHHPDYGWAFDRNQRFTINPVTEKTPYKFTGVWFTLSIKLATPSDTCLIPFSSSPSIYPALISSATAPTSATAALTATYVGYGSPLGLMKGEAAFIYDEDTDTLSVVNLKLTTLSFINAFVSQLQWTPSAARILILPDANGTIAITANKLSDFALTTSDELAGVISDKTGYAVGALLLFSKSPTIETPTIASFVNANHNHQNSAGGGTLDASLVFGTTILPTENGGNKLLSKNYTPASNGANANEELLHSHLIAASKVAAGDMLEIYSNWLRTGSANNKTMKFYVNTANTLAGATLIGTLSSAASTSTTDLMQRYIPVINDTTFEMMDGTTTSSRSAFGISTGTSVNVTVPSVSAGFWILITGQKATAGETNTIRWSMVRLNKSN